MYYLKMSRRGCKNDNLRGCLRHWKGHKEHEETQRTQRNTMKLLRVHNLLIQNSSRRWRDNIQNIKTVNLVT